MSSLAFANGHVLVQTPSGRVLPIAIPIDTIANDLVKHAAHLNYVERQGIRGEIIHYLANKMNVARNFKFVSGRDDCYKQVADSVMKYSDGLNRSNLADRVSKCAISCKMAGLTRGVAVSAISKFMFHLIPDYGVIVDYRARNALVVLGYSVSNNVKYSDFVNTFEQIIRDSDLFLDEIISEMDVSSDIKCISWCRRRVLDLCLYYLNNGE